MPYEQFWEERNIYGQNQTYHIDCGCVQKEVCKSCHQPYTNVIGEECCIDCRGGEDNETDTMYYEATNKHGYLQTFQRSDDGTSDVPVCSQCHACVMMNRGQGTICDACDRAFTIECQLDDN